MIERKTCLSTILPMTGWCLTSFIGMLLRYLAMVKRYILAVQEDCLKFIL